MEYTTYTKLKELYPKVDLIDIKKKLLGDDILYIESNASIYLSKNSLNKIMETNKVPFFRLKGTPSGMEQIKIDELDDNKYHIHCNAKEYNQDKKLVKKLKNITHDIDKSINLFKKLKNEFFSSKVLCFDIEAYEKDQSKLTEFGITIFEGTEINTQHYIVEENKEFRNGKYVEDNRDNFLFGESKTLPLIKIMEILKKEIYNVDMIVGHGINNDFKYINKIDNTIGSYKNFNIVDSLYLTKMVSKTGNPLGMKKMLEHMDIEFDCLHNAGNDAHFNMKMIGSFVREFKLDKFLTFKEESKEALKLEEKNFNDRYIPKEELEVDLDINGLN